MLRQSCDSLGLINTYINKSAVKILLPDEQCYLITKAPTWKVVIYNARNNFGFEMNMAQWMEHEQRYMVGSYDNRFIYLLLRKESLTWFGMPATKYVFPCTRVNGVIQPPRTVLKGEYITGETDVISDKTSAILEKALVVPHAPGLPLFALTKKPELKRHDTLSWRTGGDGIILRTLHKDIKDIPASYFTYPTGYTLKNVEIEVLMDHSKKQAIQDMVDHMESFGRY